MRRITKAVLEDRMNRMIWFGSLPFVLVSNRVGLNLTESRGFVPVHQYGPGMQPIREGEIGYYDGKRYFGPGTVIAERAR